MRISVVVTTYEQPGWLEKVLWGYAAQTIRDFELIVADDGSGAETRAVVESARAELPALKHVWHPDDGFRKTEILNKAILAADTEYLVFTDGDCIPRRDLLEWHLRLAEPGRFLSGGYVKLPEGVSRRIGRDDVIEGRATDFRWLRAQGAPISRRLARLSMPGRAARVLDRLTPTRASFNGHNASVWRSDALVVNGFDERMGWGGLDREFGERLENVGVRGKQIRHRAHVVHLDHPRGYRDAEVEANNRRIRDETERTGRTRTTYGLDRHLDAAGG